MNFDFYRTTPNEKPLDRIVDDGGFTSIFRTIACIGDSLASGEFESRNDDGSTGYNDMFEYSWGQYIARAAGVKVYNFSRGGMTASEYHDFAEERGFWDKDKLCQAYIMALGVNDIANDHQTPGSIADVNFEDYNKNGNTFAGHFAKIIQRIKSMQPDAVFFLVTAPRSCYNSTYFNDNQSRVMYEMAENFSNCYVIDLAQYMPVLTEDFHDNFFLGGHLNAPGYQIFAKAISSYIDYIVRKNPADFNYVPFIGTGLKM